MPKPFCNCPSETPILETLIGFFGGPKSNPNTFTCSGCGATGLVREIEDEMA